MGKDNIVSVNVSGLNGRMTRSRAAVLRASIPIDNRRVLRNARGENKQNNTIAPDDACFNQKKKAPLQDVTNVCCSKSYSSRFLANKVQNTRKAKNVFANVSKAVAAKLQHPRLKLQKKSIQEALEAPSKSEEVPCSDDLKENTTFSSKTLWNSEMVGFSGDMMTANDPEFIDIDQDLKDPQLCSLYAPLIYKNLRVSELVRRPLPNFMETIQQDISPSMRGILVDWLVEVSEEYKLVPDTLYLTVYLIDCFLSKNYIERQRLQLLGITCMLIASKYEEIFAPRIEEFCFITDNTYSREEVLKMEIQVLKYLGFQVYASTAKTFLRRFMRAAQASYKSTSLVMEFLANYLAELTLVDYDFLIFLPSTIAASAVFLARWTLDQSCHPWNPTLEHYTAYKASDLQKTVCALQNLQLNADGCPLSAIRTKYRHDKFKSVAALTSPKLLETLFLE